MHNRLVGHHAIFEARNNENIIGLIVVNRRKQISPDQEDVSSAIVIQ
jgi:hypothetical protein